jgi:dihydroorotate dehydrogenase (fumarate)
LSNATNYKPIIVSITCDIGDPSSLASMVSQLQELRKRIGDQRSDGKARIAIELNTSCPNIKNALPPGYDFGSLGPLLQVLSEAFIQDSTLTIGLKLPPFVHEQQVQFVLDQITSLKLNSPPWNDTNLGTGSVISFLTCTNTLGNSLLFANQSLSVISPLSYSTSTEQTKSSTDFALPTVLGGLAGEALHPLALGNVYRFSQSLKLLQEAQSSASKIKIIGVGGVTSKEAKERMIKAGADAVACATLFGREGVKAFEILGGS